MPKTFDDIVASLKRVYVDVKDDKIEINPEYIYMTIPADYVCTYNKILVLLAKYGVEMLINCEAGCSSKNKSIISCFNMFNAAVAARKLGQDKIAETIMAYVNSQLKIINNNEDINPQVVFPVDEDGYLKAIVSCGENPKFIVDPDTGKLYKEWINKRNNGKVYTIEDNDLIVKDNSNPSTGK